MRKICTKKQTVLFSACLLSGLLIPVTSVADMFKPSISKQIELGGQAAAELRHKEMVLPASDPRVIELRRVASKILATFPKKEPWHYSFDVIESKDVNAFALPGGPMFFYTGLLSKLKTEDELAGVIGHELTHVRRQHWAQAYADSTKRQLGLTILLIGIHANNSSAQLAGLANSLYDLQYSRGDEGQADEGGFTAVVASGYNPDGMIDLFKIFEGMKGSNPPEFVSDHPSDSARIKNIEKLEKAANRTFPPQVPLPLDVINSR